jgi:hypothetical protein
MLWWQQRTGEQSIHWLIGAAIALSAESTSDAKRAA